MQSVVTGSVKSYSCQTRWTALWREAVCLYKHHRDTAPNRVDRYFRELNAIEAMFESRFGRKLQDLDVLDIGPGPFLIHMSYLGRQNRVTGIDLDAIPVGFNVKQYLDMWRANGARRLIKTLVRKAMLIDSRYNREVERRLSFGHSRPHRVLQMDASEMTFPNESFDLVHSRSVFHHIPDPKRALTQIARVLKPGGVAVFSFHLFTSENGSLDPRLYTDRHGEVAGWPHLRADTSRSISSNAYVNKLRLSEWRATIASTMTAAEITLRRNQRVAAAAEAAALRESGELKDFTLEELLTDEVFVVWQKP